jgi:hypothetical protein
MTFEYKVVPAPTRGKKARGVKSAADRFALALAEAINAETAEGWEYLRVDTLPAEERHGLTGRTTVYQNLLIFRRPVSAAEFEDASEPGKPLSVANDNRENSAPKLPSAEAAQGIPELKDLPRLMNPKDRDVAAE